MKFAKNDGFTLVELIVVIAILAILAGAAVPAYSGYIERAEIAADQALVSAVNTAFASALVDNGTEMFTVKDATFDTDSKSITGMVLAQKLTDEQVASYNDDFRAYYSDNDDADFKSGLRIVYDGLRHAFVLLVPGESIAISYGDSYIYVSAEDAAKLVDSTFGDIGAEGLMEKLVNVTTMAKDFAFGYSDENGSISPNENMQTLLNGNEDELAEMLGMSTDELKKLYEDKAREDNPEGRLTQKMKDAAKYEILSNYAVLAAAQSTSGKTASELLPTLQKGLTTSDIKNMLNAGDGSQEALTNSAMMYAMYTAYANGLPDSDPNKSTALDNASSVTKFGLAMSGDTGFQEYLQNKDGQAEKDLEGYLSAMTIINDSAKGDKDAATNLVMNGYDDAELAGALSSLLGK